MTLTLGESRGLHSLHGLSRKIAAARCRDQENAMGKVISIRPQPTTSRWGRMPDGSYLSEATLTSPMFCVGLEVRRDAGRWAWLVADSDGEGDVTVVVRSGHAPSLAKARSLAEGAAAAVLDDAVRYIAGRAA